MRNVINVTNSIAIVRGVIVRVCVDVKRNVATLSKRMQTLHLGLRRLHAFAGYPTFTYGLQPAPAAARATAAAAASRSECWARPTSRPSTRHG